MEKLSYHLWRRFHQMFCVFWFKNTHFQEILPSLLLAFHCCNLSQYPRFASTFNKLYISTLRTFSQSTRIELWYDMVHLLRHGDSLSARNNGVRSLITLVFYQTLKSVMNIFIYIYFFFFPLLFPPFVPPSLFFQWHLLTTHILRPHSKSETFSSISDLFVFPPPPLRDIFSTESIFRSNNLSEGTFKNSFILFFGQ